MMSSALFKAFLLLGCLLFFPFSLIWAYVGPGVGITMLGTFWALVSVISVFIAGLLVWPIRSFLRRRRAASDDDEKEM